MTQTVLELIKAGKPVSEVLDELCLAEQQEQEQELFVTRLAEQDLAELGRWVADKICAAQSQAKIMLGGLLYLYLLAAQEDQGDKRFVDFCDELGISKTQAYRTIRVWKVFGTILQQEPRLSVRFCTESLKILAAEHVPQPARDRAVKMARAGQRVTIKCAAQLIEENTVQGARPEKSVQESASEPLPSAVETPSAHTSTAPPKTGKTDNQSRQPSTMPPEGHHPIEAIEFEGTSGRIRIFPNARRGLSLQELISDLLKFVEQLRNDLALDGPTGEAPNAVPGS